MRELTAQTANAVSQGHCRFPVKLNFGEIQDKLNDKCGKAADAKVPVATVLAKTARHMTLCERYVDLPHRL